MTPTATAPAWWLDGREVDEWPANRVMHHIRDLVEFGRRVDTALWAENDDDPALDAAAEIARRANAASFGREGT